MFLTESYAKKLAGLSLGGFLGREKQTFARDNNRQLSKIVCFLHTRVFSFKNCCSCRVPPDSMVVLDLTSVFRLLRSRWRHCGLAFAMLYRYFLDVLDVTIKENKGVYPLSVPLFRLYMCCVACYSFNRIMLVLRAGAR